MEPLYRTIQASYLLLPHKTDIIELASASGLTLLAEHERNPMLTSTLGTGLLIKDAMEKGARNIMITLGGSATTDAGMGIMQALGAVFLDEMGNFLEPIGENLLKIKSVDCELMLSELKECKFSLLSDVENKLYGMNGAAHVFAPQKGALPINVEVIRREIDLINMNYH